MGGTIELPFISPPESITVNRRLGGSEAPVRSGGRVRRFREIHNTTDFPPPPLIAVEHPGFNDPNMGHPTVVEHAGSMT